MESNEASPLFQADGLVAVGRADVGHDRERLRLRRLWRLAVWTSIPAALLWWRIAAGHPINFFRARHVDWLMVAPICFFVLLTVGYAAMFLLSRRSPHVTYQPEQIDVRLADVVGIQPVKEEVVRSMNLFLSARTFSAEMGGRARRGLLFEGSPGTGKTHIAKAMAAEAGVPFLYVSGTSFQSMFYGATAGKIRSYFKALRRAALATGGAIGFIEEIDAIGGVRSGMAMTPRSAVESQLGMCGSVTTLPSTFLSSATANAATIHPLGPVTNRYISEGNGGVVNELLVQMQSFDEPFGLAKLWNRLANGLNLLLPPHRQISRPAPPRANILLIAATNRADSLDPALLRPGRFDRILHFDLPDQAGRRALIDHFLSRKAHDQELDDAERRDALASVTQGYTPVQLEQLLDEALVNAVRRGSRAMGWRDVESARLTLEVGLGQPVGYTEHEKRLIATHEAGHATAAYLVAPERRLEILTIIKRRNALGLLAHSDAHEVFTRSRKEMIALIQVALAGQCAEEIFFGDVSTGPAGDLLYATNVAAQMVGASGMTGTLVSFAAIQGSALSDTNIVGRVLADSQGRERVEELLQEQKAIIRAQLEANRSLVEALRDALLDREELIGREITEVLDRARAEADADGAGQLAQVS